MNQLRVLSLHIQSAEISKICVIGVLLRLDDKRISNRKCQMSIGNLGLQELLDFKKEFLLTNLCGLSGFAVKKISNRKISNVKLGIKSFKFTYSICGNLQNQ